MPVAVMVELAVAVALETMLDTMLLEGVLVGSRLMNATVVAYLIALDDALAMTEDRLAEADAYELGAALDDAPWRTKGP